MLKLMGLTLIWVGCTGYGFRKGKEVMQSYGMLCDMYQVVKYVEQMITYSKIALPEIFIEISEKISGRIKNYLACAAYEMREAKNKSLKEILVEKAEVYFSNQQILEEDKKFFYNFGICFGFVNREMQLQQLLLFEKELEYHIESRREEVLKKKKLYESLGVLGGLFLAIILW